MVMASGCAHRYGESSDGLFGTDADRESIQMRRFDGAGILLGARFRGR